MSERINVIIFLRYQLLTKIYDMMILATCASQPYKINPWNFHDA